MTVIGVSLSSEELGPRAMQDAAVEAEHHGFHDLVVSDHFHPWVDEQGESPFVWGLIGAIAALTALKCCYAPDVSESRHTVHRSWPSLGLPGQLAQELATSALFEQACQLVDEETAVGSLPCGPDPELHAASIRDAIDAGYDEIYVQQIGPGQKAFFGFFRDEVLPLLS